MMNVAVASPARIFVATPCMHARVRATRHDGVGPSGVLEFVAQTFVRGLEV